MRKLVLLDSGPLGMATHPQAKSPIHQECSQWLNNLPLKGYIVGLPEIADYEVRRELIRAGKTQGIKRLDALKSQLQSQKLYFPITTATMLLAAQLWAQARQAGTPTADPKALDGDVILAAEAMLLASQSHQVIVASTNISHLSQFVDAREWQTI
ncbi:MAG TPA: nucleic acid-binding protein [Oscillatoriaceae cyanobacterium M33_DOE_052]|uniref:Nucleic acid-binding protein n=1 Tax=Planktothricoides sp. SpSt-374 TaxID=2282167 RepID=A0A7C3VRR8_9CYAN|nr:nucleic acid-binding protein [Oscillatoriaceae cyanobacterium M33_DOE_052]